MSQEFDFERYWLDKFTRCLDEIAGQEIREQVIEGSEGLSAESTPQEVIAWSQRAMERLDALVDVENARAVMTGCACQYPKSDLQGAKEKYAATRDIDLVHQVLQLQFETFLRETLTLDEAMITEVVTRGWGLAGVRQGNTIIATKIPKSGYLAEYLREPDPDIRRGIYCHCPRVREALKTAETLSPTYCYCGAGFYKGIWDEILGQPVQVEVLESVLQGDEVCKIAVYLPSDVN